VDAVDPWKEYAAREECRDVVRRWAALEAKSPQMADDLARRHGRQAVRPITKLLVISAGIRLIAWAIKAWWYITRP
jgi:hypothetical protein